jgi:hypothetical protein
MFSSLPRMIAQRRVFDGYWPSILAGACAISRATRNNRLHGGQAVQPPRTEPLTEGPGQAAAPGKRLAVEPSVPIQTADPAVLEDEHARELETPHDDAARQGTLEDEICQALSKHPRSAWRTLALNRARQIHADLDSATDACGGELNGDAQHAFASLLTGGRAAQSQGRKFRSWLSGSDVETAWASLHDAEERLILFAPVDAVRRRLGGIDASVRNSLKEDDPRLKRYTDQLAILQDAPNSTIAKARSQISGYLRDANEASSAAHAAVRATRNTLLEISIALIALLISACVAHALGPGFIDLQTKGQGDAVEAWSAALVGCLGGTIGALATVSRLGGSTPDPRLPNAQAFLRIPMGGAIGLLGVMLVQSGFISPLKSQAPLALLTFAFIVGYTPDLFLRYLDRSISGVLAQARGKDDPARPELAAPHSISDPTGVSATSERKQPRTGSK